MKIDGGIGFDPNGMAAQAIKAEESGYDGVWSAETNHDPFLPIAVGATVTEKLEFGTGIAVAFARNPMTLAVLANDLQLLTKGRFMLGHGQPDQAPHHQALLHAVVPPGAPHAGAHSGHPGHLEDVGDRRASRLPGRVLHAHLDDALLQSGAESRTATPRSCWPPSASS